MLRASTVIFPVPGLSNDNRLCHQRSYICVRSTVLTISWNATHQCIHSTVRLIKLNQSVLEFGAKRRHKKKQTNIVLSYTPWRHEKLLRLKTGCNGSPPPKMFAYQRRSAVSPRSHRNSADLCARAGRSTVRTSLICIQRHVGICLLLTSQKLFEL